MRLKLAGFAVVVAMLSPLTAQTAPCNSLNDSNDIVRPLVSFTGLQTWAYQIAPTQSLTVQAVRLFTENRFEPNEHMSLSIWSHNGATQFPRQSLGRGTFVVDTTGPKWQGTNLDRKVSLIGGEKYWIVWEEPGGSQIPIEPQPATRVPVARLSGSSWAAGGFGAVKYRLYCSLLDDATVIPAGPACAQGTGATGTVFSNHVPTVGNADFSLEATGYGPSSPGVWFLGGNLAWVPLPLPGAPAGCSLNTDVIITVPAMTGSGPVNSSSTNGHAVLGIAIPNVPALAGGAFQGQFAAVDFSASAAIPVVSSNALKLLLF